MAADKHHSRRDFLQGKAAARTLADRVYDWAQEWVESTTELIADRFPTTPTIHLEATRRAMACDFAIRYHDADRQIASDVLEAFDEIEAIEDQLTIYRAASDVIRINQLAADGPVMTSSELFALLELAVKLNAETEGAFDITGTPLSRVWGFFKREGRLPSEAEIADALDLVGMAHVALNPATQSIELLKPGVEINFNAMGKGYALDRAARLLDERGACDYLWHGGRSSVLARGANRGDDADCWSIGLRHPLEPNYRLAEFHLRNRALGTSGGATQFFEHEGRRYSHILDPRTGWPAAGVFTATVLAPTAAEADALSTAAFVLGPEGIGFLCRRRPDIAVVLVCPAAADFGINVVVANMAPEDWTPLCDPKMLTLL
ncbi:MAG: FAD:protein FMN transferase [Bythopirellula sp.]|nr:FAD:protein FMN transferase [Bythopirellula sp.]